MPTGSVSPLLSCGSSITLCHLNAQSLVNKIDEVRAALLDAKRPTVLGMSETWLNDTISDGEVSISSFSIYRKDRKGRRGGGILVYVHNSCRCRRRNDLEKDDVEAIWLEVHLRPHTILLCNVYRPPSSNSSTLPNNIDMVEAATSEGKEVVVLGDLNCNLLSSNQLGDELKSGMENLLLMQLITEPTRVTKSSQSLIDVLFCTHPEHFESIGTFPLTGSDHLMIYGTRAERKTMTPSKMTFRSFKHCNVDKIKGGSPVIHCFQKYILGTVHGTKTGLDWV